MNYKKVIQDIILEMNIHKNNSVEKEILKLCTIINPSIEIIKKWIEHNIKTGHSKIKKSWSTKND